MKRAALIAGVSFVALVCAGPTRGRGLDRTRSTSGRADRDRFHRPMRPRRHRPSRPRLRTRAAPTKAERPDKAPPSPAGRCTSSSRSTSSARRCSPTASRSRARRSPRARPAIRRRWACSRVIQKRPPSRLQSLRRVDALHAAHHLVGLRAAPRTPARLSGVARLRPADRRASRSCSGRRPRWARASSSRAPRSRRSSSSTPRLFVPRPKVALRACDDSGPGQDRRRCQRNTRGVRAR